VVCCDFNTHALAVDRNRADKIEIGLLRATAFHHPVKIAFVASSLEPGRDGVGDYSTLLAAESSRRGHKVALLALNDQHTGAVIRRDGLLRLPANQPWPERVTEARRWLEEFAPDWISLQFVGYGLHPRGLVGAIAGYLETIFNRWPVHLFFHEVWIGEETGSGLKHRALGWLQRRATVALVRALDVRVVHTSNPAYVHLLGQKGVQARRLPLFGSLPLPMREPAPDGPFKAVFFGTLHPVWPPEPLFGHLRTLGRKVELIHLGNIGSGAELWSGLEQKYGNDLTFRKLGALPPEEVAEHLAGAHCGIATTPWSLIGKSASVAAMLDCGLPVVVNRNDVQYRGLPDSGALDPLLIRMKPNLPEQLAATPRRAPRLSLPDVTGQFLADLEAARS